MMNKKVIRDIFRLSCALICTPLYVPHLLFYFMGGGKGLIDRDISAISKQCNLRLPQRLHLLYSLHNNRYFRTLFYYRIGPVPDLLISWYRPGDRYFQISKTTKLGGGCLIAHPYSTILNAESIGENFSCLHCTTLGAKSGKRPVIGNNVSLGANVVIIGGVKIGNNVTLGAGSVVVKDIPDNSVAAGNPARVIKYK